MLAPAITSIIRFALTEEQVNNWGWRTHSWFSLVLAPILRSILKQAKELKLRSERTEQKETKQLIHETEKIQSSHAFLDLWNSPLHWRQLAGMIGTLTVAGSFRTMLLWSAHPKLRGFMLENDADLMHFIVVRCRIFFLQISESFRKLAEASGCSGVFD